MDKDETTIVNEPLSDRELEHLVREGWLVRRGILSDAFLARAHDFVADYCEVKTKEWTKASYLEQADLDGISSFHDDFLDLWTKAGKPTYSRQTKHYAVHPAFYDLLNEETLVDSSRAFFGTKTVYASGDHNYRMKSSQLPWANVSWHADRYYWEGCDDPAFDLLIYWFPLSSMVDDEGGVEFIPLSECSGWTLRDQRDGYFVADELVEGLKTVRPKLDAGDALMLTSNVLHRSVPYQREPLFWTFDLRHESGDRPSTLAKEFGFPIEGRSEQSLHDWIARREPLNQPVGFNS